MTNVSIPGAWPKVLAPRAALSPPPQHRYRIPKAPTDPRPSASDSPVIVRPILGDSHWDLERRTHSRRQTPALRSVSATDVSQGRQMGRPRTLRLAAQCGGNDRRFICTSDTPLTWRTTSQAIYSGAGERDLRPARPAPLISDFGLRGFRKNVGREELPQASRWESFVVNTS